MKKLLNLDNTSGKLPCIFKITILLVMLLNMADANAQSGFEKEIVKGIKYRFDSSNKTASVIRFEHYDNKIYKGKVVIPETVKYKKEIYNVTEIEQDAFRSSEITSISIPGSVKRILHSAFNSCFWLTSITIPGSVKHICDNAFRDCWRLKSVTILDGVEWIHHWAFQGCLELTSVTIPPSVKRIDQGAFEGCRSLTTLTAPKSAEIAEGVFSGCDNIVITWIDATGEKAGQTTAQQIIAKAQEEERVRKAQAQEKERIWNAQAQERKRKQNIQLVDNYIKEFKEILRSGKTPELSQGIYGHLGLFTVDFAYPNKETAAKREAIKAMLTEDFREASLALDFMDVLDGLHLATSKDIESAKKQMDYNFQSFYNSNYWDVLGKAERAAGELKKSLPEMGKELDKAKMTISNWNNTMISLCEKTHGEWKAYITNRLSKWTNDALREAERSASSGSSSSRSSSSSSSSSSRSSSSVDVEKVSIPLYKFTTNWRKETITGSNTAENKSGENQVREIKFDDGTEGKIKRVIGSNGYWAAGEKRYRTLDDAIAAEYTYQKYGKRREKGRW